MKNQSDDSLKDVRYGTETVDGINVFYREAGDPSKQAVVLLHGFPTSSHMYREVLAALGDEFYLIAPDYPGYGYSDKPDMKEHTYTFDNIAETMDKFLVQRRLNHYVLLIQDFGAPVGFRIATKHPEKVAGFIVMNGNAYEEGLSEAVIQTLKLKRTPEDEAMITGNFMSFEGIKWMYQAGTRNPERINPDNWQLDYAIMKEPGVGALSLEMIYDYPNNIKLYPQWQEYLRKQQPPMLIIWGRNDPIFPEPGAAAYKKDVKDIDYNIVDTGHFALEEEASFAIEKIRTFLRVKIK